MVDAPKAWPDAPPAPPVNVMTFDEIQEVTYFLFTAKYLTEEQYKNIVGELEKTKQEVIKNALRLRWQKRETMREVPV